LQLSRSFERFVSAHDWIVDLEQTARLNFCSCYEIGPAMIEALTFFDYDDTHSLEMQSCFGLLVASFSSPQGLAVLFCLLAAKVVIIPHGYA